MARIAEEQAVGGVEAGAVEGGALEFFDIGGAEIALFEKLFGTLHGVGKSGHVQIVVSQDTHGEMIAYEAR